jgi:16S rRNA (uracil1498-N3)-methyltransferase
MSIHRFYIPAKEWNPDALILRESEAHHARDVLRLKQSDKLVVFNGAGHEITAEIVDLARDEIRLRKLHEAQTPPLKCRITLGQAIPKGKNMDLIVQKAVEIGASEIAPLISERTIVDLAPDEAESKRAKWQQVAIEAAKQCGQNWLPRVRAPRKLKDFFADHPRYDLQLIGSLQSDAKHLKQVLTEFRSEDRQRSRREPSDVDGPAREGSIAGRQSNQSPLTILMLIGPEGDFTPAELALAKSNGCRPITLGPIILRVETAAIYCLSVISYELL